MESGAHWNIPKTYSHISKKRLFAGKPSRLEQKNQNQLELQKVEQNTENQKAKDTKNTKNTKNTEQNQSTNSNRTRKRNAGWKNLKSFKNIDWHGNFKRRIKIMKHRRTKIVQKNENFE